MTPENQNYPPRNAATPSPNGKGRTAAAALAFASVVAVATGTVVVAGATLGGCGGGGGRSTQTGAVSRAQGRVKVAIVWPTKVTRAFPTGTKSAEIKIIASDGTPVVTDDVGAVSGGTTAREYLVASGSYTLTVNAYDNVIPATTATVGPPATSATPLKVSGNLIATGSAAVTVTAGADSSVSLEVQSVASAFTLSPSTITVNAGVSQTVTGQITDANTKALPIAPGYTYWYPSDINGNPSIVLSDGTKVVLSFNNDGTLSGGGNTFVFVPAVSRNTGIKPGFYLASEVTSGVPNSGKSPQTLQDYVSTPVSTDFNSTTTVSTVLNGDLSTTGTTAYINAIYQDESGISRRATNPVQVVVVPVVTSVTLMPSPANQGDLLSASVVLTGANTKDSVNLVFNGYGLGTQTLIQDPRDATKYTITGLVVGQSSSGGSLTATPFVNGNKDTSHTATVTVNDLSLKIGTVSGSGYISGSGTGVSISDPYKVKSGGQLIIPATLAGATDKQLNWTTTSGSLSPSTMPVNGVHTNTYTAPLDAGLYQITIESNLKINNKPVVTTTIYVQVPTGVVNATIN